MFNFLEKEVKNKFFISFLVVALVFAFSSGFVEAATTVLTSPYNSTNVNVTQNQGFAHLNISRAEPYYFSSSGYGLVSYFSFDYNNATTVYDLTRSRTGTLNGGLTPTTGLYGNSLKFDGVNDYVSLSSFSDFSNLKTGTISGWFMINSSSNVEPKYIFTLSNSDSSSTNHAQVGIGNIGSVVNETFWFRLASSTDSTFTAYLIDNQNGSNKYYDDTWHHFAVRMGGSNFSLNNSIFIDGISQPVFFFDGNGSSYSFLNANNINNVRLGGRNFTGVESFSNFSIDEIMIFNRSLTNAQIQTIYNNQSPRFASIGEKNFTGIFVASGTNKRLNLSLTDYHPFLNTNISVSIDGGTVYTNLSSQGTLNDLSYTEIDQTLNLSFIYHSSNEGFYTPEFIGNLTILSWAETGIDITNPLSTSVKNLTPNEKFTVSFNFTYEWNFVGENITINNLTVGGVEALRVPGELWYENGVGWKVNATTPNSFYLQGIYGLFLNATFNNGTTDFVRVTTSPQSINMNSPPAINFTAPTPATGTIAILNRSFLFNQTIFDLSLKNLTWNFNGTNFTTYDNSLVLFYNFDNRSALEENSTKISDISRHGRNATPSGAIFTLSGKYDGAYVFDGVNDYVSLSDFAFKNITVSVWVRVEPNQFASSVNETFLFWKGPDQFATTSEFLMTTQNGAFRTCYDGQGSGVWGACANVPGSYNDRQWHHVVGMFNGSSVSTFVNGKLLRTTSYSTYTDNGGSIAVGGNSFAPTTFAFNGTIDEVMIFNRSFSPSEVNYLYRSSLTKFNQTNWVLTVNESNLDPENYSYFSFGCDTSHLCAMSQFQSLEIQSSCTEFDGDSWQFFCSDYCVFTEDRIVPGNVTFTALGGGEINLSANWTFNNTNSYVFVEPLCQVNINKSSGFNL